MNVKHICFSSGVLINDTRLDIMDSVKGEPTTFCHNDLRVLNAQNVAFISYEESLSSKLYSLPSLTTALLSMSNTGIAFSNCFYP